MFYRIWQVLIIAVLACLAGLNYTVYRWFNYDALGIVKGLLRTSLISWGYISLLLGILMFATLAFRKVINVKMIDKPLEIFMIIICVMQLPMVSLWVMAFVMQGFEAIIGVTLHAALLLLIGYCFFTTHRTPRYLKEHNEEEQSDLTL